MKKWTVAVLAATVWLMTPVTASVLITKPGLDPKQPVEEQPEVDPCASQWQALDLAMRTVQEIEGNLGECEEQVSEVEDRIEAIKSEILEMENSVALLDQQLETATEELTRCKTDGDEIISIHAAAVNEAIAEVQSNANIESCLALDGFSSMFDCILGVLGVSEGLDDIQFALQQYANAIESQKACMLSKAEEIAAIKLARRELTDAIKELTTELDGITVPDCSVFSDGLEIARGELTDARRAYDNCVRGALA